MNPVSFFWSWITSVGLSWTSTGGSTTTTGGSATSIGGSTTSTGGSTTSTGGSTTSTGNSTASAGINSVGETTAREEPFGAGMMWIGSATEGAWSPPLSTEEELLMLGETWPSAILLSSLMVSWPLTRSIMRTPAKTPKAKAAATAKPHTQGIYLTLCVLAGKSSVSKCSHTPSGAGVSTDSIFSLTIFNQSSLIALS